MTSPSSRRSRASACASWATRSAERSGPRDPRVRVGRTLDRGDSEVQAAPRVLGAEQEVVHLWAPRVVHAVAVEDVAVRGDPLDRAAVAGEAPHEVEVLAA